jgi:peroxiredoxin
MDPLIKAGKPAPDFTLNDLAGNPHTLADYRGRIAVLVFWSAECPWSARADEAMTKMRDEWNDKVVVLTVASNTNESLEDKTRAAAKREVSTLLLDPGAATAKTYSATITPEVFVIDREGVLRYHGAFNNASFRQPEPTHNYLWEAVEAVLADENPVPGEMPAYGCTIVFGEF